MSYHDEILTSCHHSSLQNHVLSLTKIISRSMPAWISSCGKQIWNNIKAGKCGAVHQWQMEDYLCQLLGQQRCFCCLQTNWILTIW